VTKLISVLIVVVVIYGSYRLFVYWERGNTAKEAAKKETAAAEVQPESLPGLPQTLEPALKAAQQRGPAVMKQWLKAYGNQVQDPRKAWIELDYCEAVFRADPSEARRVFASIKARTPPSSPVWPRVKQLENSYE
jgi:hypothetical protein